MSPKFVSPQENAKKSNLTIKTALDTNNCIIFIHLTPSYVGQYLKPISNSIFYLIRS
jgi:hypothetical protein